MKVCQSEMVYHIWPHVYSIHCSTISGWHAHSSGDCTNLPAGLTLSDKSYTLRYFNKADYRLFVSCVQTVCILPSVKFHADFEVTDVTNSIEFTHNFTSSYRLSILYGNHSYKYGHVTHRPTPLSNNALVHNIFHRVCDMFPSLQFNSVLLNYYPGALSIIRLHADDEPDICKDSYILTLSLGGRGTLTFAHKSNHSTICSFALDDGDFMLFSKSSQDKYVHGILEQDMDRHMPRLSLTFRQLI